MVTAMIIGLAVVAALAGALGMRLARTRSHVWWVGFVGPILVLVPVILGRRIPRMAFVWPVNWAVHYRVEPWLMAATVPLLLATLAGRLQRRGQRVAVYFFLFVMTFYFAIVPELAPILGQYRLEGHPSVVDQWGVCRQTSEFSCGAAAAVTALRQLGITTDEATMARAAGTGPAFGTDPVALTDAINRLYGVQGVHAEYQVIGGERDLIGRTPVILEIYTGAISNHYVTVMGVYPDVARPVVVGDPSGGLARYPLGVLSSMWHGTGIFLTREKGAEVLVKR